MRLRDTVRFSLGNLRQRKLRSFLTMVGVAVGTGAIVLMVSFGVGLRNTLVGELESGESLLMIQVMSINIDLFGGGGVKTKEKFRRLTDEDVKEMSAIPGVRAAWPDLQMQVRYEIDKTGGRTTVHPTPVEAATQMMRQALVAGAWWDGKGQDAIVPLDIVRRTKSKQTKLEGPEEEAAPQALTRQDSEALIGKSIVFLFGGKEGGGGTAPKDPPKGIVVEGPDDKGRRRVTFRIAGVYDEEKMGGMAHGVYIPLDPGRGLRVLGPPQWAPREDGEVAPLEEGEYFAIVVKAASIKEMPAVQARLKELKYFTFTVQDMIKFVEKATLALEAGLACLGGIGLLVAFFGIVNTMVMAILERTREIGMLKALGARDRDVGLVFLGEAAAIGFLGALGGLGAGWGGSMLMNVLARSFVLKGDRFDDTRLFQVSPVLAMLAIAFGVVVACAAGLLPAIRASRLDPVTALRHE